MVDGKVDPRGVQALNELDPSDVERITVGTKDSPVVMVTTKRYLHDYPEEAPRSASARVISASGSF